MEICFERGHIELSFDTSFKLIELIINVWWQVLFQYFPIGTTMSKFFFNEKQNAYGYYERALNADSKYITYTYVELIVRPLGAVKLP